MKIVILNSFVMGSPGIDLFGKSHVKEGLIPVFKMCYLSILGTFGLNYRI